MKRVAYRTRPVLTALVSLSVAGTCLAVPGVVLADEAAPDAAAEQEAGEEQEAAAEQDADGEQILSFGGVRIDLPLEMEVIDLPDGTDMQFANMPGGTLSVGITASDEDEAMPEDADPQEFFAEVADGLAAELDDEIDASDELELSDGTTAYVYEINDEAEEEGGLAARILFVLVPTGDGAYATIQISCFDTDVESHAEDIDGMLSSIALSEEDPAASAEAVDLPQEVEAMGIVVNVPEELAEVEADDDSGDILTMENADGSLTLRIVGNAMPDQDSPTPDDVLADVEFLASSVEGTVGEGSMMWNDDVTTVQTYTVEYDIDDGTGCVTTYGYVVLEDGTVTMVIGDCTAEEYEAQYAAVLDAVYGSIELA